MMETVPSGTILHERYRIERVLGSGGFGHVYLAVDLGTHQFYALKEYLVTGASGQEQLKHEAAVLSQLHHPNLPAFHDAFIEHGRYYVVLNYIEGHDLTDLIRTARQRNTVVPLPRILDWILSICDAVHFMHSQRPPFIHRDIKPDNIRITSNGTAILVDLGNAKAAADGARTLFFIRHQGTPGYAPPEQYPGGSGTDIRSDVYALGGTLYFALAAHEPPSVSTRNQSMQQGRPDLPTLQEVLANNPPEENQENQAARQFRLGMKPSRPSARHLRHIAQLGALPPELLVQLNQLIHHAMGMKPKDRYPSVAEFAADLRKVITALPSPATAPPTPPTRPVDPHSTQPDLPQLYDTLQAAKEQQQRQQQISSQPEKTAPDTSRSCPRCGATLTTQSVYCPRCGTSLSSPPSRSTPSSDIRGAGSSGGSVSGSTAPGASDISAEQTLLMHRSSLQAKIADRNPSVSGPPTQTPQPGQTSRPPASRNLSGSSSSIAKTSSNGFLPSISSGSGGSMSTPMPSPPRQTPVPTLQSQSQVQQGQPLDALPPGTQGSQPSTSSLIDSGLRLKILIGLVIVALIFLLVVAAVTVQHLLHR